MTGWPIFVRHHFSPLRPASYQSWLIRVLDKCWANHCSLLVLLDDDLYVMEARGAGMVLSSWENWLDHRPYKSFILGKPKQVLVPIDVIQRRILQQSGKPYDKEALYIWHPLRLIINKWLGGTAKTGDYTCSESVAFTWREFYPEWYRMTTGDIMRSGKFELGKINELNV